MAVTIEFYRTVGKRNVQKMYIAFLFKFTFRKHIIDVARYNGSILLKQFSHLRLRKPNSFGLDAYFQHNAVVRLIEYDFSFFHYY